MVYDLHLQRGCKYVTSFGTASKVMSLLPGLFVSAPRADARLVQLGLISWRFCFPMEILCVSCSVGPRCGVELLQYRMLKRSFMILMPPTNKLPALQSRQFSQQLFFLVRRFALRCTGTILSEHSRRECAAARLFAVRLHIEVGSLCSTGCSCLRLPKLKA